MELSLNKLPWYGQLAAFVVVAAIAYGGFSYYWVAPAREEMALRQAELDKFRADINRALDTASQLPEFEAQVVELESRLEGLRAGLPEQKDVADLLRRIQTLATQSSLTIRAFTPQPTETRELHAEWPIRLQLEGTYHNLGLFFDKISKFSPIINISSVAIRAKDPPELNTTITADCMATTFVLLDSSPPAGAPSDQAAVGG